MSELQDMLAKTLKMERGKKSDKKWRDAHTFKAEQEAIRAREAAEYTERKKTESKQIQKAIEAGNSKLIKLQQVLMNCFLQPVYLKRNWRRCHLQR